MDAHTQTHAQTWRHSHSKTCAHSCDPKEEVQKVASESKTTAPYIKQHTPI